MSRLVQAFIWFSLIFFLINSISNIIGKYNRVYNENAELKKQIEQTKQCLRNSQYEEWELCYE